MQHAHRLQCWRSIVGEDQKWLEETVGDVVASGLKDLSEWVEIFTYISVILTAVNPFKSLPLYSTQDIEL